jgi:hypothetical protein
MFNDLVKALAKPPPDVAVSFKFVARTISVTAGVTAIGAVGVTFVTRVVPVLMWGRSEDAGAIIAAQVRGLAIVLTKAQAVVDGLLAF